VSDGLIYSVQIVVIPAQPVCCLERQENRGILKLNQDEERIFRHEGLLTYFSA